MINRTITGTTDTFAVSVQVPGDKSLSHRALLFAGMAEGDSFVTGLSTGLDVGSTATALRTLGVEIRAGKGGEQVRSPGVHAWLQPTDPIDCGNSGTTMRLLAGVLSTSHVTATLIGDASLTARTMTRLVDPLQSLGGVIATSDGFPPLTVGRAEVVSPADVAISTASAQVRTAFELAALQCIGSSTIDSPPGFRDHTERWLRAIGLGDWETRTRFRIDPGMIPPARFDVPGDPSSAAFLWAAAAISPGSQVVTPRVSINPGRIGFLEILDNMGADIEVVVTDAVGGDPVGDVKVTGRSLRGVEVAGDLVASTLDELPLVAVVGAYAEGITTVRNAGELRVKESDRIEAIEKMLVALDGGISTTEDGFSIVGTGFLSGGTVETFNDHRIAMAAAVAATRCSGDVEIVDSQVAAVSWPDFYETLEGMWS
ncbi:MAG: 3-phosphoshikimate 1-carboxyvinyltransferase [Acidimicrobiia bacterium]|nr:3-phosphoshikimate 1-carboxyvinyltransferase [Acidimicrobiia bacterium]